MVRIILMFGSKYSKHIVYILLNKAYLIKQDKLIQFILACQDEETGGFADRPGDMVSLLS